MEYTLRKASTVSDLLGMKTEKLSTAVKFCGVESCLVIGPYNTVAVADFCINEEKCLNSQVL